MHIVCYESMTYYVLKGTYYAGMVTEYDYAPTAKICLYNMCYVYVLWRLKACGAVRS
jgi:hypothetical protein